MSNIEADSLNYSQNSNNFERSLSRKNGINTYINQQHKNISELNMHIDNQLITPSNLKIILAKMYLSFIDLLESTTELRKQSNIKAPRFATHMIKFYIKNLTSSQSWADLNQISINLNDFKTSSKSFYSLFSSQTPLEAEINKLTEALYKITSKSLLYLRTTRDDDIQVDSYKASLCKI